MPAWSAGLALALAFGADPMNHTNLATSQLEGRGLMMDDINGGEGSRAIFPPLYPTLLAGVRGVFGASVWTTLAMNTILDVVLAWLLADIARRVGQTGTGGLIARSLCPLAGVRTGGWRTPEGISDAIARDPEMRRCCWRPRAPRACRRASSVCPRCSGLA